MDLDDLCDLIDGLGIDPEKEELDRLFEVFKKDFIDNQLIINGLKIKVILNKSDIEGFELYPETFVHLITRKSESGKRVFDKFRANRIHWIRCILENRNDERIIYFEYPESNGEIRDFYWYKEEDFVIILKKIKPDYLIITSFVLDNDRKRKDYENRYKIFKERNN